MNERPGNIEHALRIIGEEVNRAKAKHPGDYHSRHEGFAVLLEEVDELKEVIWKNGDRFALWDEARQVAAVAVRIMVELS